MSEFLSFLGVMAAVIGLPTFIVFAVPPIARAVARRVEGNVIGRDEVEALRGELEALRDEVSDLRSAAARLPELEERLDFTERLLAREREAARLPGGAA